MSFYPPQHKHYCGIALHARSLSICILAHTGTLLVHKHVATTPENFLGVIAPQRDDLVVAVEGLLSW